jgi:hypothetical protein
MAKAWQYRSPDMPHNEYTIERDSNFISGFGRSTRIVAIHDIDATTVRGEWYVLIDGTTPLADSGYVEADLRESGANHRKLTNILKNEADIHISSLIENSMSSSSVVFTYQHHWETIGEAELIELWLSARHKEGIQAIIDTTQCDPLKSILMDVIKYPPLELK